MPVYTRNGHGIYFRDDGPRDGVPVVFSNSLGTDLRAWDPLLPHLREGLRLVRYDKSGHGLSDFAGERSIESHADDLAALMDHLGIGQAVIIGLSVGGLIAQALANAHKDKVRALVLCDTGHKIGTPDIWNPRMTAIEEGGMEAVLEPTMQRWFTPRYRGTNPDIALWRNMLVRTPARGYCAVGRAIRDADFTERTRAITVPTLCVAGSEDGATPPALVRELSKLIKGSEFREISACGHLPCIEQPEKLGSLITDFLEKNALL